MRPTMSVAPAGGKGTIILIGRFGYCADALPAKRRSGCKQDSYGHLYSTLPEKRERICHAAKARIETPETRLMARNRRGPMKRRSLLAPSARMIHHSAEPMNTAATITAAAA